MQIETTRFGTIDCPPEQVLKFPAGLIGFYDEHDFILINHSQSDMIAWLQSTTTGSLAFPVVSAHAFSGYPDVSIKDSADRAGLDAPLQNFAVMAVLSAQRGHPATVNLLAPLVVDTDTRRGAQVILENSRFSARELFVLGSSEPAAAETQTGGAEPEPPAPDAGSDDGSRKVG